ncbi:disaggregatase related repeat-containing protein [Methanomethylovorans sp.]|uniref:disaggregatase related repeat-containing protein n=1 Tax=Methanomethylovorans sp. TaxID=2758717 RepID=UPI00351C1D08
MQIKSNKLVCFGLVLFMIMTTGIGSADSLSVEQVSQYNVPANAVAVEGNYAYVATDTIAPTDGNGSFSIVDITDPYFATVSGSCSFESPHTNAITVSGNYAYLAGNDSLVIMNITDPSGPKVAGKYSGYAESVDVSGNYAYLVGNDSLVIMNITDPSGPKITGTFMTSSFTYDVAVSDNYAYIAAETGLLIVDITNPSAPTLVGSYKSANENGTVYGVAVSGNYAYVTSGLGLFFVDISNPELPTPVGGIYNGAVFAKDVAISGNYAYVLDEGRRISIVDITYLSWPIITGSYNGIVTDVDAVGNYAYVASESGFTILHVNTTPTSVSYTPAYDNRLRESTPTTVLSSSNYIDIGKLSTTRYRDVMAFNLSGYETTDTIDKATLSLYWYYPASATRTSDTVVEIYRPLEWDPKYVSWRYSASGKSWTNAGGSWYDKNGVSQGITPYASVTFPAGTVPDNKYYEFDVTELVQEYISGESNNTGFLLKAKDENGNYIAFYSSDWANASQRPKLTITPVPSSVDYPPVANAGEDMTATAGSPVIFDGSGSTDDRRIVSYRWNFNTPVGISEANGVTATATYVYAGTYNVTLTVTDGSGQTSTDTLHLVVTPVKSAIYKPTYDNRLRESTPTTVLPNSNYIDIGKLSTTRYRDVMMFDLSDYKPTDTISQATLSLCWYYPAGSTRTSNTVVEIYRPVEWDPKYVSWKNSASGKSWTNAGGSWFDKNGVSQGNTPYASFTVFASTVPDNKYYGFDVTELVQGYISGEYDNTGFFLKAKDENGNYIAFYSSDWANAYQRPRLTITP